MEKLHKIHNISSHNMYCSLCVVVLLHITTSAKRFSFSFFLYQVIRYMNACRRMRWSSCLPYNFYFHFSRFASLFPLSFPWLSMILCTNFFFSLFFLLKQFFDIQCCGTRIVLFEQQQHHYKWALHSFHGLFKLQTHLG